MTMIEIIAMIATGVLCVLCVICIAALFSSKRQAKENKRAIKDIRDRLGTFGDSINEKTDQLFERLDKQQSDGIDERRLEALEKEIRQLAKVEEQIAERKSSIETVIFKGFYLEPKSFCCFLLVAYPKKRNVTFVPHCS